MADIVGSKVITEEELDSITLRSAIEDIIGNLKSAKQIKNNLIFLYLPLSYWVWLQMIVNEELMTEMSERAINAAKPDAASDVAKHIISIIRSGDK